jgi:hypothetical protein
MLRNDDECGVVTLAREWETQLLESRARHRERGDIENGLQFQKHPLMQMEGHPFDTVSWRIGPVEIKDEDGKLIFRDDCEFPDTWGERDRQVVASKYFFGDHSQGFRETSLKQMVARVSYTIALWALDNGTFMSPADAENFLNYLMMIQIHQEFAFNSPVYFNVGVHCYGLDPSPENYIWDDESQSIIPCPDANKHPQISACFIQSVDDDMGSIMRLATSEAMLFKRGSGTGTDLSTLRSSKERLSCGGTASGPVSFMAMYDRIAAIVKSGGRSRRAAKMQTLKYWHPDIWEFVECKPRMEKMARDLIRAGYPKDFNGIVYSTCCFRTPIYPFVSMILSCMRLKPGGISRQSPSRQMRLLIRIPPKNFWTPSRPARMIAAIPPCNSRIQSSAGTRSPITRRSIQVTLAVLRVQHSSTRLPAG